MPPKKKQCLSQRRNEEKENIYCQRKKEKYIKHRESKSEMLQSRSSPYQSSQQKQQSQNHMTSSQQFSSPISQPYLQPSSHDSQPPVTPPFDSQLSQDCEMFQFQFPQQPIQHQHSPFQFSPPTIQDAPPIYECDVQLSQDLNIIRMLQFVSPPISQFYPHVSQNSQLPLLELQDQSLSHNPNFLENITNLNRLGY